MALLGIKDEFLDSSQACWSINKIGGLPVSILFCFVLMSNLNFDSFKWKSIPNVLKIVVHVNHYHVFYSVLLILFVDSSFSILCEQFFSGRDKHVWIMIVQDRLTQ